MGRLVIALLVPGGKPGEVLIDDTLSRRRGKRAASWFHDGSAAGPAMTGSGNNRVVLAGRTERLWARGAGVSVGRCPGHTGGCAGKP